MSPAAFGDLNTIVINQIKNNRDVIRGHPYF